MLRDLLLDRDPAPVERLWQEMYAATLPFGRKGLAIMALSGVDLALWDLRGKAAAAPVAALLGGTTGTAVPCYLTLGRLPSAGSGTGGARREEVARAAAAAVAEALRRGYAAVKLGLGAVPAPAGEWRPAAGFHALLKMGAHHVLQPDVCWCGGMTVLRRIYELAAARGVPVRPHRGAEAWHCTPSAPSIPIRWRSRRGRGSPGYAARRRSATASSPSATPRGRGYLRRCPAVTSGALLDATARRHSSPPSCRARRRSAAR